LASVAVNVIHALLDSKAKLLDPFQLSHHPEAFGGYTGIFLG